MEPEEKPAFGALLHQYRRARHLTQEHLGEKAGYSSSYISMLEAGDRPPALNTALQLSDALELSLLERHTLFSTLPTTDEAERRGPSMDSPAVSAPLVGRDKALADLHRHLAGEG